MRRSSASLRRWVRRFAASRPEAPATCSRPIIPIALAFAAGILAGSSWPGHPWLAAAAAIALACRTAAGILAGRSLAAAPLALTAAVGYLALQPWAAPAFSPEHLVHYIDRGRWEITGVVDSRPAESDDRTRFTLQVESLQSERGAFPVSGRLKVTLAGGETAVGHGERIAFTARIRPIRNFNNPGGFDFKRHQQWDGVFAAAFVGAEEPVQRLGRKSVGLSGAIAGAREAVARQIEAAAPAPASAVLKALVVGERSAIPEATWAAFRRTGTAHLLAISGLHFALVAAIAYPLFRRLFALIPGLRESGRARQAAALATLAPAAIYAALAGMSPSTTRALLMTAAFLLALLLARESDAMNTLALAALAILAAHPPALFSISFQLSFAAVFWILHGWTTLASPRAAAGARPRGEPRAKRLLRALGAFVGVSLLATGGTTPLVLHHFNTLSLVGLPANLIAVPLVGYGVVLPALCGAFALPVSAEFAQWCFQAAGAVLTPALGLIETLAAWPRAALMTVTPSLFEVGLAYAFGLALFRAIAVLRRAQAVGTAGGEGGGGLSRRGGRLRAAAGSTGFRAAAACAALCLAAGAVDALWWVYQRFGRGDLRATVLDVGQGSAVLLELPGGRTVLVDGGGFGHPASLDVGAAVVAPFLWRRKIATVDTLVLTHPNSDHVNGLVYIAENFAVGALWTNGEAGDGQGYRRLIQAASRRGIPAPDFGTLPRRVEAGGGAVLELLYPPEDFMARRTSERFRREANNNSLVLRACLGETCLLIPGDLHHAAERDLVLRAGGRLASTALLAPHHGSRSSNGAAFTAAVSPREVFISCGGRPGIPHPEVLARYAAAGARVHRTDRHGAIAFVSDGRTWRVERYLARDTDPEEEDGEGPG